MRLGSPAAGFKYTASADNAVSENFSCSTETDQYWQQTWGAGTMFAFGVGKRKGERLTYRGYGLEIYKDPVGWRLGIYPRRPELPIFARSDFTVSSPRKDDALSAARQRIDLMLSV
jgi:hypothetical protein